MKKRMTITLATASALILTATTSAVAASDRVSGPSPFSACTVGGPGINYPNAEVEPSVTINPLHANNVVGA